MRKNYCMRERCSDSRFRNHASSTDNYLIVHTMSKYFYVHFVTMITIWSGTSRSTTLRAWSEIFHLYPLEEGKHTANNMTEGHHDLGMPYPLSTLEVLQYVSVLFLKVTRSRCPQRCGLTSPHKGLYGKHHVLGTLCRRLVL